MKPPLTALLLALALQASVPTLAQQVEPEAAIERVFTADRLEEDWFSPAFLAALPLPDIEAFIKTYVSRHGAFRSVTGQAGEYVIELEKAEVPALLALDPQGRIAGLRLQEAIPLASLDELAQTIARLPGETSLLVISNGDDRIAENADTRMAVGSAAKLSILKVAADAVEAGQLAWDQTFELKDEWRSLPTGILQDWPAGTPLTLSTIANLMISMSDNTATDAMIQIVGRDAVGMLTPANTPFLTTREFFTLKAASNAELYREWADAAPEKRTELAGKLKDLPLPSPGALVPQPSLDVEWFMSGRELCELMEAVKDLPAFMINPGVASPANWKQIAYKGGSEAGVLNLTTWLQDQHGSSHCVVATWNNREETLDERRLMSAYRGVLRNLATESE